MQAQPRLIPVSTPKDPVGAVLVLHGGATRRGRPVVSPTQLSVLRMIPTARRIARTARGRLAVFRLLNSYRGWDAEHTPIDDATWAMAELRELYGDLPLGLVGHSLGGRAALFAGDRPGVRSVVALNPWVYAADDVDLGGRRVLVVHGLADRIADPNRSESVARSVARSTDVAFLRIPGGKHAMLRHGRLFDGYAAEFVAATLLGEKGRDRLSEPVTRVLAGEEWITPRGRDVPSEPRDD